MKTTFCQLDEWVKQFIVVNVSNELLIQINRKVHSSDLLEIFNNFDLDIEVSEDQTFTIQKNDKLELAVKKITSSF